MKKHTEKQPIDDLFARKLSNMSLPPSADGFERLQARMGQNKSEARVVFWRNPVVQRYMAAAACFVLVCSLGWRYWPSSTKTTPDESQVAVNQNVLVQQKSPVEKQGNTSIDTAAPATGIAMPPNPATEEKQLAKVDEIPAGANDKVRRLAQPVNEKKGVSKSEMAVRSESVLAQTKTAESKPKAEAVLPTDVVPVNQKTSEQIAIVEDDKSIAKPNPPAERVLDVTIDEPASLVAARQIVKSAVEEKTTGAINDKPEKEAKTGLWQQVKRIKRGELFAKRDNAGDDDRGLLDRAYHGLKHSFDKDKSAKQ